MKTQIRYGFVCLIGMCHLGVVSYASVASDVPCVLSEHEQRIIDIFERVSPSVVAVANKALVRGGSFGQTYYETERGTGSGFVWDDQGHIISNYHVVHNASSLTVTLRDGSTHDAKIVGVDPDRDLAVLKIDPSELNLIAVSIGSSGTLRVGHTVLAIGNPL